MLNIASRRTCAYAATVIRQKPFHRLLSTNTSTAPQNNRHAIFQRPSRQHTRALNTAQYQQYDPRKDWRKNPLARRLVITALLGSLSLIGYFAYKEHYVVKPKYTAYPPEVANMLRRAVFFTDVEPDIQEAMKAYREALAKAREVGMREYSDEVTGIRVAVAQALHSAGMVTEAAGVLEKLRDDLLRWTKRWERAVGTNLDIRSEIPKKRGEPIPVDLPEIREGVEYTVEQLAELQKLRAKLVGRVIGINSKLAEFYLGDHIQDEKKAEASLVSCVELCLHEMQRRQNLKMPLGGAGPYDNDDAWLSLSEISTMMNDLGDLYFNQGKFELALPLFLRGLDLMRAHEGDTPTCKQVHFINAIAASISRASLDPSVPMHGETVSKPQLLDNSRQWSFKGLDLAAAIKPSVRDELCDMECVAIMFNLGWMAEVQGKREEAVQYLRQGRATAQAIGMPDSIAMMDQALEDIERLRAEAQEP